LIRAFGDFHKTHPAHSLRIYGDGERKAELQALINELGLSDCAHLMGTSKTVLVDIADAQMFAMASDYEGMPNALAEAMALGIPCISTDCLGGGAAALIQDGINGILIPIGDEQALVESITKLAEDEALASQFGNEGKKLKHTLSVEAISQQWLNYITEVISRKKTTGIT
jgi:glycosyltransferase involved in cell wall biosynthesis